MKLPRRNFLHLAAGAAALPAVSQVARAQAYPMRPVRVISPYAPGGPTDIFGRLIAQSLSEHLGKQFYVENIGGAGGTGGTGTPGHLVGEQFRLSLGLDLVHVPFNSAGLAVGATVAGHTAIAFASVVSAAPQVKEGKLRALAVTSKMRLQA